MNVCKNFVIDRTFLIFIITAFLDIMSMMSCNSCLYNWFFIWILLHLYGLKSSKRWFICNERIVSRFHNNEKYSLIDSWIFLMIFFQTPSIFYPVNSICLAPGHTQTHWFDQIFHCSLWSYSSLRLIYIYINRKYKFRIQFFSHSYSIRRRWHLSRITRINKWFHIK